MRKCIFIYDYKTAFELKENREYTYKQAYDEIKDSICSAYFIDKIMIANKIPKTFSFSGIHFSGVQNIAVCFEDINGSEIPISFPIAFAELVHKDEI